MSRSVRGKCLLIGLPGALCATPSAAACPATPEDLSAHARAAESAFASMDTVGFKGAVKAMRDDASCLDRAPEPPLAAEVHGVEALDAYFDQDQGRALLSLRAMAEVWPQASLPPDVAPEGGELRAWLAIAARVPVSPRAPVAVPSDRTLVVDGRPASEIAPDRPSLAILLGADGTPLWSGLFLGPGALPPLAEPTPLPEVAATPPRGLRAPLWGAAGGLALLSVGLMAGGLYEAAQVEEVGSGIAAGRQHPGVADADALDALIARTNGLGIAGQIAGGLAVGAFAVGWTVRW